jgi:hypothetical protein
MSKKDDKEKDTKIFTEWTFNDLKGNLITVRPWSYNKTVELTELIGDTFKKLKAEIPDLTYASLIQDNLDRFLIDCPAVVGKVLYRTADLDQKWLDNIDLTMALQMLEVIIQQNFTGERVAVELIKFLPAFGQAADQAQS